jgi:hypothetical protein
LEEEIKSLGSNSSPGWNQNTQNHLEQKNKAMEQELVKTVGRTSEYEHRVTMLETQLKQMKSKWEDATMQVSTLEK